MAKLDQIDLNALNIFDAVVEAGSFTRAADRLGVAKAKISVQIGRLERQLGSALFTRTTRQVNLTEDGRSLHEQCQPYLMGLRDALTQVGSAQNELTGVLRVSASVMHAAQSVAPALTYVPMTELLIWWRMVSIFHFAWVGCATLRNVQSKQENSSNVFWPPLRI
jgi:hypothetical protein